MSADELPDDVASLLAAEQFAPGPPAGAKARVLERIDATLAGGGGPDGSGGGGGNAAGSAHGSSPGILPAMPAAAGWPAALVGGVVVVIGVGVGVSVLGDEAPAPASDRPPPAAPASVAAGDAVDERDESSAVVVDDGSEEAPSSVVDVDDSPAPAPAPVGKTPPAVAPSPSGARSPPETASSPTKAPVDTLAEEQALLERARAAVHEEAGAASAALREHEERFPEGQLVEEREALLVLALARSGQATAARKRAQRFFERWPSSLHAGLVHAALAE